ncbi:MAG: PLP-dependent aminotransferase family protein [Aeromicrobium sp.]|uniref:aminotransferase-like domain-containing protein n=1 Tax=Aeromicrobium sp. TaxID=1871063 RepID=UPI0039E2C24F
MTDSSSERIAAALRAWIETAPPGARLPSSRALVAQFEASPVTVQKALRALTRQGLVETRPGVGAFVRESRVLQPHDYGWQTTALGAPPRRIPQLSAALRVVPNDVIALHSGYPDADLLPSRLVRSALARAARAETALSRSPAAGLPELQSWFAAELAAVTARGLIAPKASDVVVLPGSQSGLSTLFRTLVGAGEALLIESPSYWGAILAAAQVGVRLVPIPAGPHGPDPADVEQAFARTGARAFYAQPNYANPTGAQWPPDVARRVLDIVRDHHAFLIEDDWAHDFGVTTESSPLAAHDDTGHVVYLRSLTKSVSPSVRVAGLIARGPARDRILDDVQAQSMYVSPTLQAAALDVVSQPGWQTHRRTLRDQLARRRDLLVAAMAGHAPAAQLEAVPPGGLNLWFRLPDATDLRRLTADCEDAGVIVAAGDDWFPAEPTGRYLRLNYAGPHPAAFADGARVVGKALSRD